MQTKYLLTFCFIIPDSLYAARILSIFAVPIASQYVFIEPLLKELARRGHEITSISNYPQDERLKNFRDIVIEKNKHLFDEYRNFTVESIDANYYETVDEIYNRAFQMCKNILSDPLVRHIMQNEKFDLVMLDVFFSESFYGFSEYLKAPMVGVSNFGGIISVDELVGNIRPLSYIPEMIFTLKEMNFRQRLLNVVIHFVEWIHYYCRYMPVQKQIYQFYFPNASLAFEEAQKSFSLVLLNDHFSLSQARPYVPNMIEVAGLHIDTNPKPLSREIKALLNNARQGVILVYLDLGFNTNTTSIFLAQFRKMPHLIVWKTSQYISSLPPNVLVADTLNIPSIIRHPNIKLYITTGSFASVVESVYHSVPILGIASTEKETDYVDYVRRVGNGVSLKLHLISEQSLTKAFHELLFTTYYANISKTLSLRFRDQQNTPMERAVYWIEYVLRHNGADHLKNMGQNLTWWQFYNLDVFAVIFLFFFVTTIFALFIFKIFIQFIFNLHSTKGGAFKEKET